MRISLPNYFVMTQWHLSSFNYYSLPASILRVVHNVVYQSFVTTAPPPTGKGGDYDFSVFNAML